MEFYVKMVGVNSGGREGKRTLQKVGLGVLLIATVFGTIIYFGSQESNTPFDKQKLIEALEQGEKTIDLKEIAKFEWDDVKIFGPYTTDEMMAESFGIPYEGRFNSEVSELNFCLVFVADGQMIKRVNLSRQYGNYNVYGGILRVIPK